MSDNDAVPASLADLPDGLIQKMGIEVISVSADRAVGTMPVEGNTQPYGLLHGGASAVLAETLGSLAAMAHALESDPDGIAVGVDLSISHLASARTGTVTATATALRRGRTMAVYQVEISDESGAMIAAARLSCAIRSTSATRR
ncbi:PaaI family thioesterase [Demequina lignilytica]|uniref:PaaI family thioesterase n=1 Tax=Demequina lignilytica TaxID=3051663 RepID=A0AB35ML32_9MICO|nr:PaaI family thioesterase [Demequina sp. SYSU T0a273]MDN4484512.1 PaaI family thioesterase [Demequina sp. SYSU T0a273]